MSMILDGTITFSDATVQNSSSNTYSLGLSQTWQDLTASRAIGTTYYNTTGKPIYLYITGAANITGYFVMQINGVTVATSQQAYTNGTYLTLDIIVSPGASYSAVVGGNSPSIVRWSELR
jgi:hypothetical protein